MTSVQFTVGRLDAGMVRMVYWVWMRMAHADHPTHALGHSLDRGPPSHRVPLLVITQRCIVWKYRQYHCEPQYGWWREENARVLGLARKHPYKVWSTWARESCCTRSKYHTDVPDSWMGFTRVIYSKLKIPWRIQKWHKIGTGNSNTIYTILLPSWTHHHHHPCIIKIGRSYRDQLY